VRRRRERERGSDESIVYHDEKERESRCGKERKGEGRKGKGGVWKNKMTYENRNKNCKRRGKGK
jgi:hypothetical protein